MLALFTVAFIFNRLLANSRHSRSFRLFMHIHYACIYQATFGQGLRGGFTASLRIGLLDRCHRLRRSRWTFQYNCFRIITGWRVDVCKSVLATVEEMA